jgi:hypothetical protein
MGVVEKVRQNCPCYHTYLCYLDQGDRGSVRSHSPILFVHSAIAAFQRRWRGVRCSKLFVAYTTNTAQQRRRTRWVERCVLVKRLNSVRIGDRISPWSAKGKARPLPCPAFGASHEIWWPWSWFRCTEIGGCSSSPNWVSFCRKGIVLTFSRTHNCLTPISQLFSAE